MYVACSMYVCMYLRVYVRSVRLHFSPSLSVCLSSYTQLSPHLSRLTKKQVSQSPIQRQLHRVLEECGDSCSRFKVGLGDNQAFLMVSDERMDRSVTILGVALRGGGGTKCSCNMYLLEVGFFIHESARQFFCLIRVLQ